MSGDPILGYVSLGRGITIHREDCPNVAALRKDPERFVPVAWDGENETSFKVELQVDAWDRHRLLEDLSRTFAEAGINIVEARCIVSHPMVKNRFVVEVGDTQALKGAINRLRSIDAVFDAYRVTPTGGWSATGRDRRESPAGRRRMRRSPPPAPDVSAIVRPAPSVQARRLMARGRDELVRDSASASCRARARDLSSGRRSTPQAARSVRRPGLVQPADELGPRPSHVVGADVVGQRAVLKAPATSRRALDRSCRCSAASGKPGRGAPGEPAGSSDEAEGEERRSSGTRGTGSWPLS